MLDTGYGGPYTCGMARPLASPASRTVALIGDVVASRRVADRDRFALQRRLEDALDRVNRTYRAAVLSRFLVTLGDECQGLLTTATPIPDILWDLERDLPDVQLRWGIGRGVLTTALRREALGMDGPALHRARAAITDARRQDRLGGVFSGFGSEADTTLSALGRLLHYMRSGYTVRQREVVQRLRANERSVDIASDLQLSRQAVSLRSRSAGWPVYAEGEAAWRTLLAPYDDTAAWRKRGWRPGRAR